MNVYKFSTIALAAILIFTILYFRSEASKVYFLNENGDSYTIDEVLKDIIEFNELFEIDEEQEKEFLRRNSQIDPDTTGKMLSPDTAAARLESFTRWNRQRFNFRKEIKPNGFAFGREKLRKLLDAIDRENNAIKEDPNRDKDSLIMGVRANLSHTFGKKKKDTHIDLMFVPIMYNGKNYLDLTKDNQFFTQQNADSLGLLLNTSAPCPNNCHETQ